MMSLNTLIPLPTAPSLQESAWQIPADYSVVLYTGLASWSPPSQALEVQHSDCGLFPGIH